MCGQAHPGLYGTLTRMTLDGNSVCTEAGSTQVVLNLQGAAHSIQQMTEDHLRHSRGDDQRLQTSNRGG